MIFHYKVNGAGWQEDDQEYFEKRFAGLSKFMKRYERTQNSDTVEVRISMDRNRHSSGAVFESSATIYYPEHGRFHAEVKAENMPKCADLLLDKLKVQLERFRSKH